MTRIDPWHHALDRKTGCDDLAAGVQPGLTAILSGRMAVGDQAQLPRSCSTKLSIYRGTGFSAQRRRQTTHVTLPLDAI